MGNKNYYRKTKETSNAKLLQQKIDTYFSAE